MTAYASQFAQDRFLDRVVFRGFRNGFFVDVGAHDGEIYNNTVVFERDRQWRGLCIEPNPIVFARLQLARRAECLQFCVAAASGETNFLQIDGPADMLSGAIARYAVEHRDRITAERRQHGGTETVIRVPTRPLRDIFEERRIGEVHFLSVDTEGSEDEVLRSIDYDRVLIHAIAVENNYRDERLSEELVRRGFMRLLRLGVDTIFVNRRSPFFSRRLRISCLALRAAARVERKFRRLGFLARGVARFPYKKPQ
jgi:FkbM family methyltransferase